MVPAMRRGAFRSAQSAKTLVQFAFFTRYAFGYANVDYEIEVAAALAAELRQPFTARARASYSACFFGSDRTAYASAISLNRSSAPGSSFRSG